MEYLQKLARLIRDHFVLLRKNAPLLGLALAAVAGALGLGWSGCCFLGAGLLVSREGTYWKVAGLGWRCW